MEVHSNLLDVFMGISSYIIMDYNEDVKIDHPILVIVIRGETTIIVAEPAKKLNLIK